MEQNLRRQRALFLLTHCRAEPFKVALQDTQSEQILLVYFILFSKQIYR